MVLSMGPQHPSTHGVLQLVLEIDGEDVVKAEPEIGYLHTGIEKSAEGLFWTQAQTRHRADGLSRALIQRALLRAGRRKAARDNRPHSRARPSVRVLLMELTRIASHCVWLGTHGIDLGAISVFFYCFDLRENILDLQEANGGARMHPNYLRVGGLNGDLPDGYLGAARRARREVSRPHPRAARFAPGQPDFSRPHDRHRHPCAGGGDRVGRHRARPARQRHRLRRSQGLPVQGLRYVRLRHADAHAKATPTRVSSSASTRWTSPCALSSRRASGSTRRGR